MRTERLYLQDILDARETVERFLRRTDETAFMQDDLIQSAVLQKLIVIGEAAARLPRSFTEQHPEIEWSDMVAFRNIAVHTYFAADWRTVWLDKQHESMYILQAKHTVQGPAMRVGKQVRSVTGLLLGEEE